MMSTPQQYKLPYRLEHEFDRMILLRFRDLERVERKISTFRNHLHFTLHCKHHGVFPPSLTLNSSMKGPTVDKILHRAQLALLHERVTRINKQLDDLKNKRLELDEFLFTRLPGDTYDEIIKWMTQASTTTFNNVRNRQQTKFTRLVSRKTDTRKEDSIVEVSQQAQKDLNEKWVCNLSNKPLTAAQTSVLKRGLNFAVTPKTPPINEYIIGIESACRCIGAHSQQAAKVRSDCVKLLTNSKSPKPNISSEEQTALKTLSEDPDIMVLPADKGRSVVVMNSCDYKQKAGTILADTKTYRVEKRDPTAKFTEILVKKLQELKNDGSINDLEYKQLYPTSALIPRFYGLPKVHKQGAPLRPIVASRGSITYQVARLVADILSPLVGKNGFSLKNSAHLVDELSKCTLDEEEILVSFDVTALFTCVPVDQSLEVIYKKLIDDTSLHERTKLSAIQVRDLLAICLKTTYFLYNDVIYTQVEGAAMGSPVSPIVANLFMEWFESSAIDTFQYEIKIWRRYVDDTMVILRGALLEDFTTHINSVHPAIKFTREEEVDGTIAMLDTQISKDAQGNLSFSVYRKPTHTDQYLQFNSNQPLQHKLGVIRTLHHRANTICSDEKSKEKEINHLKKVLSISGYTKSAWVTATKPKAPTVPTDPNKSKIRGSISLPYTGPVSDAVSRVIRQSGVAVHMKPYNTIRSRLVHPKDKVKKEDKTSVVYHIQCADCPASYVGETERVLRKRIAEHNRSTSPVGHHMKHSQHTFSADGVSVVHQEVGWFRRGVAEAIHIERKNPSLNRDRGRHTLPPIYRGLISSHVSPSSISDTCERPLKE